MSDQITRIAHALDFAARKHTHQRRKGTHQEPYVNHLAEVAHLVAEATGGEDANLVIAALLHDCVEDQGVKAHEIAAPVLQALAKLSEVKVFEGALFKSTYVEADRSVTDWKKLAKDLAIPADKIAEYTNTTAVFSIKTTSR